MPRGVVWCDLADVSEAGFVPSAVAIALRLPLTPRVEPIKLVCSEMKKRARCMVVLDNAEHVVEATGVAVSRLVGAVASLHIAVTSQVPLRIGAERVYRLAPTDSHCLPRCMAGRTMRRC